MRHPQLIGMACWGFGHLVSNGEPRSIVLFGGLTAWAIIEIFLLNRRDGEWTRPEKASPPKDIALIAFSLLVYMAFFFTHHILFGGTELI